jgi:hypothetical protein
MMSGDLWAGAEVMGYRLFAGLAAETNGRAVGSHERRGAGTKDLNLVFLSMSWMRPIWIFSNQESLYEIFMKQNRI